MYLNSFNYFRGIAIIYIVAAHTYWLAHWQMDQRWERFINNLVSNGTVLFVFISGFLFHHVFYPKFKYSTFVRKKIKNVFFPYLILSTPPILYYLFHQSGTSFEWIFFNGKTGIWNQYLRPALLYYSLGGAQPPYWYIPFIMLTFLVSPLHIKFINIPVKKQTICLVILLIISTLLHRPLYNLNPIQAFGYFSSVYFLGIYCSIHKNRIYNILKGKDVYLLIPILGLAAFQAWKLPSIALFAKPAFKLSYPDLLFLQKIILCFFYMVLLHRFESVYFKSLDYVARASFAIFYLHCFVILLFERIFKSFEIDFTGNVFIWMLTTALIIYFSYLLAVLLKKIIPVGKSRFLIGW